MKKKIAILTLALVMSLSSVFALAACGSDDIVGTWEFYSLKMSGKMGGIKVNVSFTAKSMTELDEMAYSEFTDLTFEFHKDGTVTSPMMGDDDEVSRYKMKGKKVIPLDKDGKAEDMEGVTLQLKSGKLVMSVKESGMSITATFKKVKGTTPDPDTDPTPTPTPSTSKTAAAVKTHLEGEGWTVVSSTVSGVTTLIATKVDMEAPLEGAESLAVMFCGTEAAADAAFEACEEASAIYDYICKQDGSNVYYGTEAGIAAYEAAE